MSEADQSPPEGPKPPRKKPGPPKGVRYGGKQKGSKNKATIERERQAQLAAERAALQAEAEAKAGTAVGEMVAAQASGRKLMKEIGFELTQLAAGLMAYYQPWPQWEQARDAEGRLIVDGLGRPRLRNANPNYDESKFDKYLTMAMGGARDFAAYESPKLAAVILAQGLVGEIQIVGGLPDEEDGGFRDAPDGFGGVTIEVTAVELKSGAASAGATAAGAKQGPGDGPVLPQGAGPAIPNPG